MMQAVILAGGKSSRFWPLNSFSKCLFKIMGKPIIYWTILALQKKKIKDIIVVQPKTKEIERELKNFPEIKIKYVVQKEPKGMGNALWQARKFLKERFLVLNAERVDIDEIIEEVLLKIKKTKCDATLLGQKTKTPQFFGILKLKKDKVLKIVEKPSLKEAPSDIKVLGVYFLKKDFFSFYEKIKKHQYDFEDALSFYMKKKDVRVSILKKEEKETPSLKFPWDLFGMSKYLMKRYLKRKISQKAEVKKGAKILGDVVVEKGAIIFEGAIIKGPCFIGENVIVGNNSLVREFSNIEKDSTIGALCEVKNSIFQENVSVHSGYFGDSILERGVKVGAGTITANVRFDRKEIHSVVKGEKINTQRRSFGTAIGKDTKIGINVSILPGVFIGKECLVYPGRIVEKNLPDKTVFK